MSEPGQTSSVAALASAPVQPSSSEGSATVQKPPTAQVHTEMNQTSIPTTSPSGPSQQHQSNGSVATSTSATSASQTELRDGRPSSTSRGATPHQPSDGRPAAQPSLDMDTSSANHAVKIEPQNGPIRSAEGSLSPAGVGEASSSTSQGFSSSNVPSAPYSATAGGRRKSTSSISHSVDSSVAGPSNVAAAAEDLKKSSSPSASKPRPFDEAEANPDLYGLRRSVSLTCRHDAEDLLRFTDPLKRRLVPPSLLVGPSSKEERELFSADRPSSTAAHMLILCRITCATMLTQSMRPSHPLTVR